MNEYDVRYSKTRLGWDFRITRGDTTISPDPWFDIWHAFGPKRRAEAKAARICTRDVRNRDRNRELYG